MVDRDPAALERRWLSSRSVRDKAAWLRAKERAGLVSRERLLLAAYLGDRAAGRVVGRALEHLDKRQAWLEDHGLWERAQALESWLDDWRRCHWRVTYGCFSCLPPGYFGGPTDEGWGSAAWEYDGRVSAFMSWAQTLGIWGLEAIRLARVGLARACRPLAEASSQLATQLVMLLEQSCLIPSRERELELFSLRLDVQSAPVEELGQAWAVCSNLAISGRHVDARYQALWLASAAESAQAALPSPSCVIGAMRELLCPWALGQSMSSVVAVELPRGILSQAEAWRAQLRGGGLERGDLSLLSILGHAPATIALQEALPERRPDLDGWLRAAFGLESRSRILLARGAALASRGSAWSPAEQVLFSLAGEPSILRHRLHELLKSIKVDERVSTPESERGQASARAALYAGYAVLETGPEWAVWEAVMAARELFALTRPELSERQRDEALREGLIQAILAELGPHPSPRSSCVICPKVAIAPACS